MQYQWFYQVFPGDANYNNSGLVAYSTMQSTQIQNEFQKYQASSAVYHSFNIKPQSSQFQYKILFNEQSFQQINEKTSRKRILQRLQGNTPAIAAASNIGKGFWQYQENSQWKSCDAPSSSKLQGEYCAMIQKGLKMTTFVVSRGDFQYDVSIDNQGNCQQANQQTGVVRKLKRSVQNILKQTGNAIWYYKENSQWNKCDAVTSQRFQAEYQSMLYKGSKETSFTVTRGQYQYGICLDIHGSYQQTNQETGVVRDLKRIVQSITPAKNVVPDKIDWFYEQNSNWMICDNDFSQKLQSQYKAMIQSGKKQATFIVQRKQFQYSINIDNTGNCSQKNQKTGVSRNLKRQEHQAINNNSNINSNNSSNNINEQQKINPNALIQSLKPSKLQSKEQSIYLVGQKDKLKTVKAMIQSSIQLEQKKIIDVCNSYSVITKQPIQYREVKKFELNHPGIKVLLNNNTFQLQGFGAENFAKPFRDYVQQVQLSQMGPSVNKDDSSTKYPPQWTNPTSQNFSKPYLYPLASNDNRYKQIQSHFNATCKNKIIKIERIQSLKLWDRYHAAFCRAQKEKRPTNVRFMFHGTRQTPPQSIYDSEQGFDIRFAHAGMWGTGNYFAKNSSYSHGYAHTNKQGEYQMFYARLQVGNSYQAGTNSDSSLKKPPPVVAGQSNLLYDSVSANTQNTDIVILYSNQKCYPEYLITYK